MIRKEEEENIHRTQINGQHLCKVFDRKSDLNIVNLTSNIENSVLIK